MPFCFIGSTTKDFFGVSVELARRCDKLKKCESQFFRTFTKLCARSWKPSRRVSFSPGNKQYPAIYQPCPGTFKTWTLAPPSPFDTKCFAFLHEDLGFGEMLRFTLRIPRSTNVTRNVVQGRPRGTLTFERQYFALHLGFPNGRRTTWMSL